MNVRIYHLMREKAVRDGRDNPITQDEVAEATGIPQGTISRWAGNKVDRLDKRIIIRLCDYFECEVGDLLKIEDVE